MSRPRRNAVVPAVILTPRAKCCAHPGRQAVRRVNNAYVCVECAEWWFSPQKKVFCRWLREMLDTMRPAGG